MKRNLGSLSLFTAGLVLLLSVPAPAQEVASVARVSSKNEARAGAPAAAAEEMRAEISRLQSRKAALQKYIMTVDPASADFLTTARSVREVEAKLKELNDSLQALAPARKLTLAAGARKGKYKTEVKLKVDPSYSGDVRLAVVDRLGNEVFSRTISNLARGMNDYTADVELVDGDNVIAAASPDDSETSNSLVILGGVEQPEPAPAAVKKAATLASPRRLPSPDDGFPVALSLGGLVVSQQAQNFNQVDPFFGFIAGYTSQKRAAVAGWRWNLRFQGIFTAAGRTAEAADSGAAGGGAGDGANDPFKFIASRKTFDLDAHAWIDLFANNDFSIGPYGAWGASAVMDRNELQGEAVIGDEGNDGTADNVATESRSDNDLKQFKELGLMMNLKFGDPLDRKLLLQAILAHGWYEGLKDLDRDDDSRKRFIGKLRIFPEGLNFSLGNKTVTPMFGVEVNAGAGPDQLKFFSGFAVRLKGFDLKP